MTDTTETTESAEATPGQPSPAPGLSLRMFLVLVVAPFLLAAAVIFVASVSRGGGGEVVSNGATYTFEIPAGTAERMARGEPVEDVFPERMAANVGDTYVVVNLDDATHQLGPIVARAGETARITFFQAGSYIGACTVGDHDTVTIVVT